MENPNFTADCTNGISIRCLAVFISTNSNRLYKRNSTPHLRHSYLEKQPESLYFPLEVQACPSNPGRETAKFRELYKIFISPQDAAGGPACGKSGPILVVQRKRTAFPQPFGNPCGKPVNGVSHNGFGGEMLGILSVPVALPQASHSFSTCSCGNSTGCGKLVWKSVERLQGGVGTPLENPSLPWGDRVFWCLYNFGVMDFLF